MRLTPSPSLENSDIRDQPCPSSIIVESRRASVSFYRLPGRKGGP